MNVTINFTNLILYLKSYVYTLYLVISIFTIQIKKSSMYIYIYIVVVYAYYIFEIEVYNVGFIKEPEVKFCHIKCGF